MSMIKKMTLESKTVATADAISAEIMDQTQASLGMIPNMYGLMANNTALLDGYRHAYDSFRKNSGFTPPEQEVVFLSVAFENECDYCMAAHSFVADNMTKVPVPVTDAIRDNTDIPDAKLKALSLFTRAVTSTRGLPSASAIDDFLSAGYTENNILGVIAGVGIKTMSNYFNHIFNTPVDDAFAGRSWTKPA